MPINPNNIEFYKKQIIDCELKDQHRLLKQVSIALRNNDFKKLDLIQHSINESLKCVSERKLHKPTIKYPEILPISEKINELKKLIDKNQVLIVAGETGSGKTTQLPKIFLELGYGNKGLIGHTQPRRLAARTVSKRLAEELHTELGELVGYKVRFHDSISRKTKLKLMTDGILLSEIEHDKFLNQYEVLIIDEAHERSLNIDFILGFLKKLVHKRKDLKILITSATIDLDRFSKHFNNAPIIRVSGKTFPVEVRYLTQDQELNFDEYQALSFAIDQLDQEELGDILIFLTGEREIRDFSRYLQKQDLFNTDILPLYSRLSNTEQNKIFNISKQTKRRIILATNVAETSLTVPGIKYVIDFGTARVSRYSYRTKVQRLPIEKISKASANQRKGRCGRTSPGICYRLYSEEDFNNRIEYTEPEILRTNLASVILKLLSIKVDSIQEFPFIDKPDTKYINDGFKLLDDIGAIYSNKKTIGLTKVGKVLGKFPIDPKMSKMIIEANHFGVMKEILIIVSFLSIQDPREFPNDKKQLVKKAHEQFFDKNSDFLSILNLWFFLDKNKKDLSGNQFKKLCQKYYLNYLRVREWQDLVFQLMQLARNLKYKINDLPEEYAYDLIHKSILSGLITNIGFYNTEQRSYRGTRNAQFFVFPTSNLFHKSPKWILSSELVETSKLWARNNAKIQPTWVEEVNPKILKRTYSEPHWSKKRANVMAYEKSTLYGLPIIEKKLVNYDKIDPIISKEIFIRHALIYGEWLAHYDFIEKNKHLISNIQNLENKVRKRDILVEEDDLFHFFDERIPDFVTSKNHFDVWWKKQRLKNPNLLNYEFNKLKKRNTEEITLNDYPDNWIYGGYNLKLEYDFQPGNSECDGVSILIPKILFTQIKDAKFEWFIPAYRKELITSLIKALPKNIRKNFVPAPNYAEAFLNTAPDLKNNLTVELSLKLRKMTGFKVEQEDWNFDLVPDHLKFNFKIIDENNHILENDRDFDALRKKFLKNAPKREDKKENKIEKKFTYWGFGSVKEVLTQKKMGYEIKVYPGIKDNFDSVIFQNFESCEQRDFERARAITRLCFLNIKSPINYLHEKLSNSTKLAMYYNKFGNVSNLLNDCIFNALGVILKNNNVPNNKVEFDNLLNDCKENINETTRDVITLVENILMLNHQINKSIKGKLDLNLALSYTDINQQLSEIIFKGFVKDTSYERLCDYPRYLNAIQRRLEKLPSDPFKDRSFSLMLQNLDSMYKSALSKYNFTYEVPPEIKDIKWDLQELRVSLFAQILGTKYPISEKRIKKKLQDLL